MCVYRSVDISIWLVHLAPSSLSPDERHQPASQRSLYRDHRLCCKVMYYLQCFHSDFCFVIYRSRREILSLRFEGDVCVELCSETLRVERGRA